MTEEERYKIISEDYADLLNKYNENPVFLKRYGEDVTNLIINRQYAVLYVPVSRFTERALSEFIFPAIPSLYGLTSKASLEASGITTLRKIPNLNLRGEGTLIGIVDTGIDYTNPVFRYADGSTKIAALWDQMVDTGNYPEGFFYGTEYTREQINTALNSDDPLRIVNSTDDIGHGTMLAGIAAGVESPANDFYGVAPLAELAVVKLKPAKIFLKKFFRIPGDAICYQENDIMTGVKYLIRMAERVKKPIAICIALGSSFSSHEGADYLSDFLSIQGTEVGNAIVISAGNEGNNKRHYSGSVDPKQGYDTVELNVGENEGGFSMELWGSAVAIFSIDILSPSGEYIPRITGGLEGSRVISFLYEKTVLNIDYQLNEIHSGNPVYLIRFQDPAPGIWRIRVYARSDMKVDFHIWLPMGDFISDNTYFIRPDPFTTVLQPGNATVPMCVTAYDDANQGRYLEASKGFTRMNRVVPDFAAPGVNVIAPTLTKEFRPFSGTGVAAAHTAGVAAMLLEWGIVHGNIPRMNTLTIKILLVRGAERSLREEYPNRNWGYGILDIYNTFQVIRGSV